MTAVLVALDWVTAAGEMEAEPPVETVEGLTVTQAAVVMMAARVALQVAGAAARMEAGQTVTVEAETDWVGSRKPMGGTWIDTSLTMRCRTLAAVQGHTLVEERCRNPAVV